MEFRQLNMLLAVVECGGYSKAGERLRISHSAIHRQIRLLEEELGERLVARVGNQVRPTKPLDRYLTDGQWHTVTLDLANDPSQWTCLGSAESRRDTYGCAPLDAMLGNVDDDLGFLMLPVDPARLPEGIVDFDDFVVTYKAPCRVVSP